MSDTPEIDVGEEIRALREAAGLSQSQLAQMAGTNQQTVQRIEAGTTGTSRATPKILEILRHVDLRSHASSDELVRAYLTAYDKGKIKKQISASKHIYQDQKFDYKAFTKVFSLIFSNEIEPGIFQIESGKSVKFDLKDLIPSPERLFAIYIPTSDMEPELQPGDIVLADTLSPPIPNVTCIFHNDAENGTLATVKRLISSSKDEWHVKSWSPEQEMSLPKNLWPACIRVVGKFSRR